MAKNVPHLNAYGGYKIFVRETVF